MDFSRIGCIYWGFGPQMPCLSMDPRPDGLTKCYIITVQAGSQGLFSWLCESLGKSRDVHQTPAIIGSNHKCYIITVCVLKGG